MLHNHPLSGYANLPIIGKGARNNTLDSIINVSALCYQNESFPENRKWAALALAGQGEYLEPTDTLVALESLAPSLKYFQQRQRLVEIEYQPSAFLRGGSCRRQDHPLVRTTTPHAFVQRAGGLLGLRIGDVRPGHSSSQSW
jgi:hypothetical protein